MGYRTDFTGEIAIVPPLPWGQIQDSPFLPDRATGRHTARDLKFRILEEAVDTDEGRLYRRTAVALVSTWDDDPRGYDIVEHLQEAIDAYPDREFTGRLDCAGEESGDLWRLEVHGRVAVRVEPRIVWPDGSEGA
jgi:hypothetical protein